MDSSRSSTLVNTCLGLILFPAVDDDSPHATSLMMDRDDNERPPPLQDIVTRKVKDQFEGKYDIFERDDLQSLKQETVDGAVQMAEELNRITLENKRLIEMLTVVCKSYNDLETHVKELMTTEQHLMPASNELMLSAGNLLVNNKKRKSPTANDLDLSVSLVGFGTNNTRNTDHQTRSSNEESYKRPSKEMMTSNIVNLRISRVYVRCDASDTSLIVKDGFQWRKYGEKVTRDNPSPRAYYRCSFAPSCPVKKKVQKSAENPCLLVATYEGEHNHVRPAGSHVIAIDHKLAPKISSPSSNSSSSPMSSISSCVLDCLNPNQPGRESEEITARANIDFKQLLVQQMASSLTKDANFTTALAAAVSAGRFTHQPHPPPIPKW